MRAAPPPVRGVDDHVDPAAVLWGPVRIAVRTLLSPSARSAGTDDDMVANAGS